MNKRQQKKHTRVRLQQIYDETIKIPSYTRIHKYPHLILWIDPKQQTITIRYYNLETGPLPYSVLQNYIGSWNDPKKMYQTTEQLTNTENIFWIQSPFVNNWSKKEELT